MLSSISESRCTFASFGRPWLHGCTRPIPSQPQSAANTTPQGTLGDSLPPMPRGSTPCSACSPCILPHFEDTLSLHPQIQPSHPRISPMAMPLQHGKIGKLRPHLASLQSNMLSTPATLSCGICHFSSTVHQMHKLENSHTTFHILAESLHAHNCRQSHSANTHLH